MTEKEIAVLGHAFFDGKTLQFKFRSNTWQDWTQSRCPDMGANNNEWRIKPDEPKTITICTFVHVNGDVARVVKDSFAWGSFVKNKQWTRIKSLDQVVEVE